MSDLHKVIDVKWFSGRDTVGAVLTRNHVGVHKVYIGPVKTIEIAGVPLGEPSEDAAAMYIADWGAKIYDRILQEALFPQIKKLKREHDDE